MNVSVGIDIGGTFTDIIVCPDGGGPSTIRKVPTTAHDPGEGLATGLAGALADAGATGADVGLLVHGTTVGTNTLLQRNGAAIGIITTRGFEDILYIGRAKRSEMYDLFTGSDTPDYLCPRARVFGVAGRIDPTGTETEPLDEDAVLAAADRLVEQGVEAVAVSLLFSFADPAHEHRVKQLVLQRHPQLFVSLSSQVDPRFREFERLVATAMDAYIRPKIGVYIAGLQQRLTDLGITVPLQVMESHGGVVSGELIAERAVGTVLSGLAGGAAGATAIAHGVGYRNVLGFDMGGTSTDVTLVVDGRPLLQDEAKIGGHPLRVPTVDVHTIGAGGGSIAYVDEAGSLRVGPRSAGSDPGPAAYGWGGTEPTVTDANLLLGLLGAEGLAGGSLRLSTDLARKALTTQLCEPLGMDVVEAAWGIHRIASAAMSAAVRVVSVARGHDPRNFALVACGGAGALHACTVADDLGIDEILVPPHPGVLSAYGLLSADMQVLRLKTFQGRTDELDSARLRASLDEVAEHAVRDLRRAGATGEVVVRRAVDARYVGQSHELTVPIDPDVDDLSHAAHTGFAALHEQVYGQRDPDGRVEIIGVRATAVAPRTQPRTGGRTDTAVSTERDVYVPETGEFRSVPVVSRAAVPERLDGPAVIVQEDTTILVRQGWHTTTTSSGTLLLRRTTTARGGTR